MVRVVLLLSIFLCCCNAIQTPPSASDWANAIASATAFVQNLTNLEKTYITTGVGWYNGPCVGNTPPIPRVGFPGFCLEDSPTGVRFADNTSAFPAGVNVASTWNRTLIYERAAAMGVEFKGKGVNIALAPMMNLGRVACGGRNWEGFGADPYLAGEAAYQSVLGIQDQGVIATAKHYILNEQENWREVESSNIDNRTLHEMYLWPFMQAVRAGVGSIMCSYNQVNNVYACENDYTLNTVLKGELGFKGYIMSDWAATHSGVPAVNAGLDMTMPGDISFGSGTTYFGAHLVDYVDCGNIAQARLDDMAIRIMTPYFLLGQNEPGYPAVGFDFRNSSLGPHLNVQADHKTLIRQIGADSTILLKNEDVALPFSPIILGDAQYTFALIGSDAGPNPAGPNSCADHGCDIGTLAQGWGSGTSVFPYLVTPLDAITARAAANSQTVTSLLNDTELSLAQQVAQSATVAIVFVNADSGEEYITVEGNKGDRNNLSLWHGGDALIEAVASVNSYTVVVMHVVGPVLMPWINHPNVSAVVLAGIPGQESGNSLADVLFGDVNPSGKLVYTIAKNAADYPASVIYDQSLLPVVYSEKLLVDYRWFDSQKITPLFPFGFGLSYTTFTYANIVVTPLSSNGQWYTDTVQVTADITNTGLYDGQEVAQLYLSFPAYAGEPPKILRGFDKVFVPLGGTTQATFTLTAIDLSVYDQDSATWEIPSGQFVILIASSSADSDIQLNSTFTPSFVFTTTTTGTPTTTSGSATTTTGVSTGSQCVPTSTGSSTSAGGSTSLPTSTSSHTSAPATSTGSYTSALTLGAVHIVVGLLITMMFQLL